MPRQHMSTSGGVQGAASLYMAMLTFTGGFMIPASQSVGVLIFVLAERVRDRACEVDVADTEFFVSDEDTVIRRQICVMQSLQLS